MISTRFLLGSHNSFTTNLDTSAEMADSTEYSWVDIVSQLSGSFQTILSYIGISLGSKTAKDIALDWSKTQEVSTTQQLVMGIRYFDARLGYQSSTGMIRVVHGLYGQPITQEFAPIAAFARSHPEELIILYLRSFVNFNSATHSLLAQRLRGIFNNTLLAYQNATATRNLASITLSSIASARQGNVIVIYDEQTSFGQRRTSWPPGGSVVSLWAGNSDPSSVISHVDRGVNNYLEPDDDRYSFFLEVQGVATPREGDIATRVTTSSSANLKNTMAEATTRQFTTWLNQQKGLLPNGAINLCLADFVTQSYVDAVIRLNP